MEELRDRGAGEHRHVRVAVAGGEEWVDRVPGAEVVDRTADGVVVALRDGAGPDAVLDAARAAGAVTRFELERPDAQRPVPQGGGGVRLESVALVARRELTERVRERSFMVGTALSIAIVALVVVLPSLLGFGGDDTFKVATTDARSAAVAEAAQRNAGAFDAKLELTRVSAGEADEALRAGDVDVVLAGDAIRANEQPDDKLVDAAADRRPPGPDRRGAAGAPGCRARSCGPRWTRRRCA